MQYAPALLDAIREITDLLTQFSPRIEHNTAVLRARALLTAIAGEEIHRP